MGKIECENFRKRIEVTGINNEPKQEETKMYSPLTERVFERKVAVEAEWERRLKYGKVIDNMIREKQEGLEK